ncbi:ABC transporter substrate-binding protein [Paenibacillus sp. J5C_2022]|uniref:ABC transporter substrate-binding protein n=1 Tax=Paenibacillus sp. J5C2022 TaxID=2977129 RepID=UPI0021D2F640|nr:ABC transporter substrate-binding protein [Paenibacillus sp. J5C2022]MCU6709284.1 ABC transporter substrate-binding protein [Paenibacillus sp. J5C2022]
MKKSLKVTAAMLLTSSLLLSACGSGNSKEGNEAAGNGGKGGETKTISIFQLKVEIAEALNGLKAEYEKEHPGIKLDIQTVGGGADYGAALKTKFASGEEPDIFINGGHKELETWIDSLEDLSNEPWVSDLVDVAKEPMTKDGKLYGMPANLEGYGFLYNKDLFEKAGITETPDTLAELEDAAKKLEAIGVTPFSNGYQEVWVLGLHLLNVAFANQEDPDAFIQGLNDGSATMVGNPIFEDWVNLFDLTLKYGNKNPLTTDYNTQMTLFAKGEAAMAQQGNWTQVQIDGITPGMNVGILPMPINNNEGQDKLMIGVPTNWVVNKNSPVKEEAKDFLNWLVTSETGKRYITQEFKFIPAVKSIETKEEDLGPLGSEVVKYSQEDKALSWNFNKFPDGGMNEFASPMQAYVAGKIDSKQLIEDLQKAWVSLNK